MESEDQKEEANKDKTKKASETWDTIKCTNIYIYKKYQKKKRGK